MQVFYFPSPNTSQFPCKFVGNGRGSSKKLLHGQSGRSGRCFTRIHLTGGLREVSWSQQLSFTSGLLTETSIDTRFFGQMNTLYKLYTTLKINPNNAMETAAAGQKPLGF